MYWWFLPTKLGELMFTLDADVVADVSRAEQRLSAIKFGDLGNTEGIARLLLRSESVASLRIEGLVIGSNRILRAELWETDPNNLRYDSKAAAVLGNIHAMERAIDLATSVSEITRETICQIHKSLCADTDLEPWGGVIRTVQNWVGGSSSNPLSADYVPPAPEEVPTLLDDLAAYMNRQDVSPIVQAALCHAQFESIHPFIDGNGRAGRALIQVCLIRRVVVGDVTPPISLALATQKDDYFSALHAFQHATDAAGEQRAINDWVSCFAGAVTQACDDMSDIASDLRALEDGWRSKLGRVRAKSALDQLLVEIQGMPYFSVETMRRTTGRSKQAVNLAIQRLVDAQIVRQTNRGKRSRVFEVPEILAVFNMVERRLASPLRHSELGSRTPSTRAL